MFTVSRKSGQISSGTTFSSPKPVFRVSNGVSPAGLYSRSPRQKERGPSEMPSRKRLAAGLKNVKRVLLHLRVYSFDGHMLFALLRPRAKSEATTPVSPYKVGLGPDSHSEGWSLRGEKGGGGQSRSSKKYPYTRRAVGTLLP